MDKETPHIGPESHKLFLNEENKTGDQKMVAIPDGRAIPGLGQGTWRMGENAARRDHEIESLRLGIKQGMTLIDTAEMYGSGGAEELIGEAIQGFSRKELFLVSKVYPYNAGRENIFKSCASSLKRLSVDCLDLYLLHWRGSVPLRETVECMGKLIRDGLIKGWGVSNFDLQDMQELWKVPGGDACLVNQVLYHLGSRGIEFDLLPWMREKNVPVMAYSPLAQAGRLRNGLMQNTALLEVCRRQNAQPGQILLAFVMQGKDIIAIPKAGSAAHVLQNAVAAKIELTPGDIALLSQAYPAPTGKLPLDMS